MLNMQSDLGSKGGEKLFQQMNYEVFLTLAVGHMDTNELSHWMLLEGEKNNQAYTVSFSFLV